MSAHASLSTILNHAGIAQADAPLVLGIVTMPRMSTTHRAAFVRAWDAFLAWDGVPPSPVIELRSEVLSIDAVCTKLWACTDPLPAELAAAVSKNAPLSHPLGNRTYAGGARVLRRLYQSRLGISAPQCEGSP